MPLVVIPLIFSSSLSPTHLQNAGHRCPPDHPSRRGRPPGPQAGLRSGCRSPRGEPAGDAAAILVCECSKSLRCWGPMARRRVQRPRFRCDLLRWDAPMRSRPFSIMPINPWFCARCLLPTLPGARAAEDRSGCRRCLRCRRPDHRRPRRGQGRRRPLRAVRVQPHLQGAWGIYWLCFITRSRSRLAATRWGLFRRCSLYDCAAHPPSPASLFCPAALHQELLQAVNCPPRQCDARLSSAPAKRIFDESPNLPWLRVGLVKRSS